MGKGESTDSVQTGVNDAQKKERWYFHLWLFEGCKHKGRYEL